LPPSLAQGTGPSPCPLPSSPLCVAQAAAAAAESGAGDAAAAAVGPVGSVALRRAVLVVLAAAAPRPPRPPFERRGRAMGWGGVPEILRLRSQPSGWIRFDQINTPRTKRRSINLRELIWSTIRGCVCRITPSPRRSAHQRAWPTRRSPSPAARPPLLPPSSPSQPPQVPNPRPHRCHRSSRQHSLVWNDVKDGFVRG